MRAGKVVLRVGLVVVGVLLAIAAVLYWQASRIPDAYHPAELTREQRVQVAKNFSQHVLLDFSNIAQNTVPGEWQITQKQLNQYLASMDEIAASRPGARAGTVHKQMDEAGISAPAAALGDGVLTLMLRVRAYNIGGIDESNLNVNKIADLYIVNSGWTEVMPEIPMHQIRIEPVNDPDFVIDDVVFGPIFTLQ